jgi:ADP-heptose:LPS heptosyltransferase
MDYFLLPGEKAYAQGVWKSMKGNKKVVVVPAGSNKLKNWHGMAEVTKRLREQGHRVVWNDNTVTLAQIGAIISEADLVISPDTGPQVVACALEVPVITVFSNRNHKPFELMFPTMIPLRGNCPYSEAGYCDYKMLCHPSAEGPYLGKENSIPGGEPECFRNLGVDTVMAASEEILK